MKCLLDVRFNMIATVLNDYRPTSDDTTDVIQGGHFETIQDPITGAISQKWIPDQAVPNMPGTTTAVNVNQFDIDCYVKGFTNPGFLSTPNTQSFDNGKYIPMEIVILVFPAKYFLNRNQYITNIRNRSQTTLWLEEETNLPTVFQVQGVTPGFDAFGRHVDNTAVLRRSRSQ